MMRPKSLTGAVATVALLIAVCPAYAQAPVTTRPTLRSVTIPSGTRLEVALGQQLSTKTDRVGDTFSISLARSVVIDGETALAEGTPLLGQIVDLTPGRQKVGRLTLVLYRILLEEAGVVIPIQSRPLTLKRKTSVKVWAIFLSALFAPEVIGGLIGGWGEGEGAHMGRFIGFATGPVALHIAETFSTRDLVLAPKKKLVFRLIGDVTIEKR